MKFNYTVYDLKKHKHGEVCRYLCDERVIDVLVLSEDIIRLGRQSAIRYNIERDIIERVASHYNLIVERTDQEIRNESRRRD